MNKTYDKAYTTIYSGSGKRILQAVTSHLVFRRAMERSTNECINLDSALALIRPIYRLVAMVEPHTANLS
jgi:hypothetical protein